MDAYILMSLLEPIVLLIVLLISIFLIATTNITKSNKKYGTYHSPGWNYFLKKMWARRVLNNWKKSKRIDHITKRYKSENLPVATDTYKNDVNIIWGSNSEGASVFINFTRKMYRISEVTLILTMPDGEQYLLPGQPDCMHFDGSSHTWTAGGLALTALEPYRWRIVYNGILTKMIKNEWTDSYTHTQHVKFNFIWRAASPILRTPDDCSVPLMAEALALEPWRNPYWMQDVTKQSIAGYDQYGNMSGVVVMEGAEPITLVLPGIKLRRWGRDDSSTLERCSWIIGTATDGTVFQIGFKTYKNGLQHVKFGNIRFSNGDVASIDELDFNLDSMGDSLSDIPKALTVNFKAASKSFIVVIHTQKQNMSIHRGGRPWTWENKIVPIQCGINGIQGNGLLQLWNQFHGDCPFMEAPLGKHLNWFNLDISSWTASCVNFSDNASRCPALVGAKGASLALLSSHHTDQYKVPKGFCLTIRALEQQLAAHESLRKAISEIENVTTKYSESDLKESCTRACKLISVTPLTDSVREVVLEHFVQLRIEEQGTANHSGDLYFAVRSSGIGEDSEELSAAGQNATILGCQTSEDVLRGIQQCWSSLFTFQSVEYRRQHGVEVQCGMGVVVQVVVEAKAAGVMFTRHPSTGNPSNILITSNYGLGESVVSGQVEPDSIILHRDLNNQLSLKSFDVGKKTHKIIVDKARMSDEGVASLQLSEEEATSASVTEEQCLMLGIIALEQESLWGSPRDIEWAIVDSEIYLLQVRPITSLNQWTEFELCHELDSPVMSNDDLLTFANTGEVLPGCISPLTHSTIAKTLDNGVAKTSEQTPSEVSFQALASTHYHVGLNVQNTFLRVLDKEITIENKVMDIAIYGHIVTNEKMHAIGVHRNGHVSSFKKLSGIGDMIWYFWYSKGSAEGATSLGNNLTLEFPRNSSSQEMYKVINDNLSVIEEITLHHNCSSSASIFSEMIMLIILIGKQTEFSSENYTDIGTILSSCSNVVSAEVPVGLRKLATTIKSLGITEEFCQQKPEDMLEWLEINHPAVKKEFVSFLDKYGHRCIKEFDLMTDTWSIDPTGLIRTLQATVSAPLKTSDNNIPAKSEPIKFISPINKISRLILNFIIPLCQKSVARREITKAGLILAVHKFRMAYTALADRMVKEWRIQDAKMIFFFTNEELGRYLQTRNPGYLTKAMMRRRYFSQWDKLQFPEMNWGFPLPFNVMEKRMLPEGSDGSKVVGTPVCSGTIVGRACVITNISEIGSLQNLDILITHSTDIGWSPYFPLLGGVVTELGGLISHGAVVAREYGLPCLVGAQGATSVFKTGDTILLNANQGFLQKLE